MYQGYPDFQHLFSDGQHRLIAAWQQEALYYLYPDSAAILAQDPLAFSLTIIRSQSSGTIYGTLDFTTELQFARDAALAAFNQQHPGAAIHSLPVTPYKLSFSAPLHPDSMLTDQAFDPGWYAAQAIQFLISLDAPATQLVQKTLLDDVVGFNARLDGFIDGVSPQLGYRVECDPRELVEYLAAHVSGAQPIAAQYVAFPYMMLTQYLWENLAFLPMSITPALTLQTPERGLLFAQALSDRLFNALGRPYVGPASSNTPYVALLQPQYPGRLIIDLSTLTLAHRPLCFLLDPFAAARQIAKVSPQKVIHEATTPALPAGKKAIMVFYAFPQGLDENVFIDVQLTLPAGNLYPETQQKTQTLVAGKSYLVFEFINNSLPDNPLFYAQVCVNYPTDAGNVAITGERETGLGNLLTLNYTSLPCTFLTLNIDPGFARHSQIRGTYHTAGLVAGVALSQSSPDFSYPVLEGGGWATLSAYALDGSASVALALPVTQSATIGAYSFPQFGAQKATITVHFAANIPYEIVAFQAQGEASIREHTFTPQNNQYAYTWNVTSIYTAGFRYRTRTGAWSDYVTGDQTLIIKA
ncbi:MULTISPECIES: hypothetical protein [Dickeya]|uniref:Uncharacterized protein n=1 Tax=Dickeya aquatica TaxID=1401087 RepID=A0A375A996_9GAMM|nr:MULTISPECIES: hypothetical protein [Dickeya]SLM62577.1 FIG01223853: hypothetical protein [Dickeya aquatica]